MGHPMRSRVRGYLGRSRPGLLGRVVLATGLVAAVIAVALSLYVRHAVHQDACAAMRRTTAMTAALLVSPQLDRDALTHGFDARSRALLARVVDPQVARGLVRWMAVVRADGRVLWASGDRPPPARLR